MYFVLWTSHPKGHENMFLVTRAVPQLGSHKLSNGMDLRGQLSFSLVEPCMDNRENILHKKGPSRQNVIILPWVTS